MDVTKTLEFFDPTTVIFIIGVIIAIAFTVWFFSTLIDVGGN